MGALDFELEELDADDDNGEALVRAQRNRVMDLLDEIDPLIRIHFIYDLFTGDVAGDKVDLSKAKALQFKDLNHGDKFIVIPRPGDDCGHGGLKAGCGIFIKIRGTQDKDYHYQERDNAVRLTTGMKTTMPPGMNVFKVL